MVVGCIGDMHGRAFHALAALLKWQSMREKPFDLVVQVGDLGVLPNPKSGEIPYDRFSLWDPSVYDIWHLILNKGEIPELMEKVRSHLASPIRVVSGNHDEFAPIREFLGIQPDAPAPIDPHDIFLSVPDGYTVEIDDEVVGFCEGRDFTVFDEKKSSRMDVLVSHEGGFGIGAEKDELAVGSDALLEHLKIWKPRYHVFGHFHHPVGPRVVFETQCMQLSSVVSDPRRNQPVMEVGSLGALDTETGSFEFLDEPWLTDFTRVNGYTELTAIVEGLNG